MKPTIKTLATVIRTCLLVAWLLCVCVAMTTTPSATFGNQSMQITMTTTPAASSDNQSLPITMTTEPSATSGNHSLQVAMTSRPVATSDKQPPLQIAMPSTQASTSGKQPLQIVWMAPLAPHPSTNSYPYSASSSVAALALALETAKNIILKEFELNVTFIDSGCNRKQSLGGLVDLLSQIEVDVVIGPPCANVLPTIAELMSYQDIPIISWVSLGQTISDKTDTNTYIRTMAPMSSLGGIMTSFFYSLDQPPPPATPTRKWRRFVIISSRGDDYNAVSQIIENNLAGHQVNGFQIVHHYADVRLRATSKDIDAIYKQIKHEGRLIILVIPQDELRTYMLRAHALSMTSGDYQFLFAETKLTSDADIVRDIESDILWRQNDTDDDDARQAFKNVLIFALRHNTAPVSQWTPSANKSFDNLFQNRTNFPRPSGEPDKYAPYLHDSIILYANTLAKSLKMNYTKRGSDIYLWTSQIHFRGLSGDVVMNSNGDRQPTFSVYDMNETGMFHQVANFQFILNPVKNSAHQVSSSTNITWGDGTKTPHLPRDTPECGFFDEKCLPNLQEGVSVSLHPKSHPSSRHYNTERHTNSRAKQSARAEGEDNSLVIALAATLPLLVLVPVLYIIYRWWLWKNSSKIMSWRIFPASLDFSLSRRAYAASVRRHLARTASFNSHSSFESPPSSPRDPNDAALNYQIFTQIARYNGDIVAVKRSLKKKITLDRAFLLEMKHMMAMKHGNLNNFIGVCTTPEKICSVWEYCNKGSLQDVIENDDIKLDTMFKMSMAVDICQGLEYIHKSPLKFHGSLRSSNCVIDNRWVCKITDYGVRMLKIRQDVEEVGEHAYYAALFWTAPEVLRKVLNREHCEGSQPADVYALGVIIKELMCRNEAYATYTERMTPREIIQRVAYPDSEDDYFRPGIQECELGEDESIRQNLEYLIRRCWAQDPYSRPVVKAVLRTITKLNPFKKASVVDNMIAMMETYTNNLEDVVAERTEQLRDEKKKTDELLYRMLPQKVAEDLKFGRAVQAEAFDNVTIYFSDIVHFTDLASQSTPLQIVEFLNALYTLFDDIIEYYDVYKVETIGDAYMVVSGLPERNGQNHVKEIAGVALDILNNVKTFKIPHDHSKQLQIRIGLHTGSVVAGVVGLTMPRYCLFGDTVNTASRMESTGKPLMIHISSTTRNALCQYSNFTTEVRGEIPVKGKGLMKTYWLTGEYQSGAQMQKKTFHKPLKLTGERRQSVGATKIHETSLPTITLQVPEASDCKSSITDSGIASDKSDDKDTHETETDGAQSSAKVGKDALDDKRQTYVNALMAMTEDDSYHARSAWPKLASIEEALYATSESEDDGLYEAVLNHFMVKERKVSRHNDQAADVKDVSVHFNVDEVISEEGGEAESSKSHSKRSTPKDERRKKRRRKKSPSAGDLSPSLRVQPDLVRNLSGDFHTGYYLDDFEDSDEGTDPRFSNAQIKRWARKSSDSPHPKKRDEMLGDRKLSWFNGGKLF